MANERAPSTAVEVSMYDDDFYKVQMEGSYRSARRYAELLSRAYRPDSVADVGCGRGTWLKAFRESGAQKVVGFDGLWNTQANMVDENIAFHPVDLNGPIRAPEGEKFDLSMSLEVAEHLLPSSSEMFVSSLTDLADVVLFGAAFSNQGGTNHINERPHTFWANIFLSRGYVPFDMFRPVFWGDDEIEFWYQQNTFLYVRKDSGAFEGFTANGFLPIENISFMNCVHPYLFGWYVGNPGFRKSASFAIRAGLSVLQRWFKK